MVASQIHAQVVQNAFVLKDLVVTYVTRLALGLLVCIPLGFGSDLCDQTDPNPAGIYSMGVGGDLCDQAGPWTAGMYTMKIW